MYGLLCIGWTRLALGGLGRLPLPLLKDFLRCAQCIVERVGKSDGVSFAHILPNDTALAVVYRSGC